MEGMVSHTIRPIGSTFYYQKRKYHIVDYTMDKYNGGQMLVYLVKFYEKHYQWWHYEAITAEQYDFDLEHGLIKEKR